MGFTTLLTTVVGTVIGAIKDVWMLNQKAKIAEHKALMAKAGITIEDRQDARKHSGFQFTRRILAIGFMVILLTPVYLVIQDPNVVFNVPVVETKEGFSFLFGLLSGSPSEDIVYIQVQGYVYMLAVMDMIGFIVGFYFGSSGTQVRV